MVNACHRNTVEGAGLGTFAATFTNILIEDNTVFTHGNGVKRTSFHAFGLRALTALYGLCHVLGNLNLDTRRKVVAVRVHVEYILSRVIERGLKMGGRTADITIALSDQPGQLSGVSSIIAEHGANVVSVNYDSTDLDMNITDCFLKLGIETRDNAHIESIKQALTSAGFEVCG